MHLHLSNIRCGICLEFCLLTSSRITILVERSKQHRYHLAECIQIQTATQSVTHSNHSHVANTNRLRNKQTLAAVLFILELDFFHEACCCCCTSCKISFRLFTVKVKRSPHNTNPKLNGGVSLNVPKVLA